MGKTRHNYKDQSMDRNEMAHSERMTVKKGLSIKVQEG